MNRKSDEWKLVGGLSEPSKMPCFGYSLPAATCKVGSILRGVEGSVCEKCYAHVGNYRYPTVQNALYRRLDSIVDPRWTNAMITLIKGERYFRWHDSGDFQDETHLRNIFDVCKGTPKTRHWAPTREYQIVKNVLKSRKKPRNLALRLSGHMIDEAGPVKLARRLGCTISEVRTKNYTCPAPDQGNNCGDCRKCWDNRVMNVV
jgi:hypothetical protein